MTQPWWQRAVIYQIYPRSFQDSDADGVGDLAGIESRLGYLQDLGVDAIWISPVYPSPMADFGYDVRDYCDIDKLFGTLADFDRLLASAHERGMRVILDFVPNHTSDQHPWFIESRSSRTNARRDWYLWRDPAPGGLPPNNWISDFGGSAWAWDAATEQYYYHAFLAEQPDLNWRNPDVRTAMLDVLRFWLDRGVDGFRIDVLWHLIKDQEFRDNPPNPDYDPKKGEMDRVLQHNSTDQPEVHAIAAEMRQMADSYGERLLIGEIYLPVDRLMTYYGPDRDEVHLPFNFQLIDAPWNASDLARIIGEYEAALPDGAWPNWVLGNHDRKRIAARIREAQARVAAMLLLTLRGTPTLYYGDELGIGAVEIPPDRVRDPRELREPGLGVGRDTSRTPMAWDESPEAGFTTAEPWLPLHADWRTRNVASEATGPGSMFKLYRALLALRRTHDALSVGDFALLPAPDDVLMYERREGTERLLIALNLGPLTRSFEHPDWARRLLLSTLSEAGNVAGSLRPNEGVILGEANS
jgi:glycosidase